MITHTQPVRTIKLIQQSFKTQNQHKIIGFVSLHKINNQKENSG